MLRNPFKELDANIRKRSSDLLRRGFDFNKIVNQRATIVISVVFVCFLAIALRLIQIQYIEQESYLEKLKVFTQKNQTISPPRGEIYDRNGNILVTNQEVVNITYYPQKDLGNWSESKWKLAYKFTKHFDITNDDMTERDWKEYYLVVSDDNGRSLLTNEELNNPNLTDSDLYSLKIKRISAINFYLCLFLY